MIKIKIYGKIAREIGIKEMESDSDCVADVFRHLVMVTDGGFARKFLKYKNEGIYYSVFVNRDELVEVDNKDFRLECDEEVCILPVNSMSIPVPLFLAAGLASTGAFGGSVAAAGGFLATVGTSLILSVGFALLSMLLAPSPPTTPESGPGANRREAYLFDGRSRTVTQGTCVPILYGRMIIPGSVIYNRVDYIRLDNTNS